MTAVAIDNASLKIDLDHPAVTAVLIKRKQAGTFDVTKVLNALSKEGIPDAIMPTPPTIQTALKRAMEDSCRGDKSRHVEITGKKSKSKYTIINTDRERLDLEASDGKGVSDAELTARIDYNQNNGVEEFTIVFTPNDHPSIPYIRERVEYHRDRFNNVYDLGVWLGHTLIPYVNAVQTGSGDYFLPKGDGLDVLTRAKNAFTSINSGDNFVKIMIMPQLGTFEDVVDAITDCVLEAADKVCGELESRLNAHESQQQKMNKRGISSATDEASKLRDMLAKFSTALGTSFDDIKSRIDNIETTLGFVEGNI